MLGHHGEPSGGAHAGHQRGIDHRGRGGGRGPRGSREAVRESRGGCGRILAESRLQFLNHILRVHTGQCGMGQPGHGCGTFVPLGIVVDTAAFTGCTILVLSPEHHGKWVVRAPILSH